jgi:iron complex outermembrane receptor protein
MSKGINQWNHLKWSTLAVAVGLVTPAVLFAAEGDEALVLEEIIVTAQKRGEERLIDVPISISVVGEENIKTLGLQNLGDLSLVVPGLSSFESAGTPGQQRITMRGIGADSGINSTVGYYWDEIPAASVGISPEGTTLDLNRIEVLRGPQGTLFGEGSMGGTLRFISNAPDLGAFGGDFYGGYSSVDHGDDGWNGTAVLNAPVVEDVFGFRIAGEIREEAGYIDNIQLGTEDVNERKLKQLRARARWQANDEITVDATYYHYDNEAGAPNLVDDLDTLTVSTYQDVASFAEVDAFNAVVDFDLGFANLLSSSSFSEREQTLPSASGDGVNSLVFVEANIGTDDFIQELRLTSNNEGPLRWTVGGYYTTTDVLEPIVIEVIAVIPGGGALVGLPGTDLKIAVDSDNFITAETESWALFGEVSYDFTERLTGTVGARYFESQYDWVNDVLTTTTTSILFNGIPLFEFPSVTEEHNTPSGDDDAVSPKFNLAYAFAEDTMGYINIAKGFRAGGVNLILNVPFPGGGIVQLPESYEPETLWTYEVGAKSLLDDGRWLLEGAAYYTDWTDLQAVFFPFEGASVGGTKNQGSATVTGMEAAVTFLPAPTVALSANASYTDATFDDATADHDKGDPVPYVPEFSFSAAMDWRPSISDGMNGLLHLDYSYQDEIYRINNSGIYKISESDSFGFLNVKLGIEKDSWGAYLVGRNLTDDQGAANPVSPDQTTSFVTVRPRMLGMEFRARF